jgi:DNA-binding protein HU-beta
LVASVPVGSRPEALRAELALKRLPKDRKIAAIQLFARPSTTYLQGNPKTMNKSELVEAVAKSADMTKVDAEKAINAVVETIVKTVAKGGDVALIGFGSFKPSKRAARTGKNPKTGEALKIAATTVPKFSAGATFKAAVAGKKAAKKK